MARCLILALILLTSCASAPRAITTIADKVEYAIDRAEEGYETSKAAAEALCATFPGLCEDLRRQEALAEAALTAAERSLALYRQGSIAYDELARTTGAAISAVREFIAVIEASKRSVARR